MSSLQENATVSLDVVNKRKAPFTRSDSFDKIQYTAFYTLQLAGKFLKTSNYFYIPRKKKSAILVLLVFGYLRLIVGSLVELHLLCAQPIIISGKSPKPKQSKMHVATATS